MSNVAKLLILSISIVFVTAGCATPKSKAEQSQTARPTNNYCNPSDPTVFGLGCKQYNNSDSPATTHEGYYRTNPSIPPSTSTPYQQVTPRN